MPIGCLSGSRRPAMTPRQRRRPRARLAHRSAASRRQTRRPRPHDPPKAACAVTPPGSRPEHDGHPASRQPPDRGRCVEDLVQHCREAADTDGRAPRAAEAASRIAPSAPGGSWTPESGPPRAPRRRPGGLRSTSAGPLAPSMRPWTGTMPAEPSAATSLRSCPCERENFRYRAQSGGSRDAALCRVRRSAPRPRGAPP